MNVKLKASELGGALTVPPSKSYAHRALIVAALADGQSILKNLDLSTDIKATLNALATFGMRYKFDSKQILIMPQALTSDGKIIDCSASGSTLRFLIPLACHCKKTTFIGKDKLIERTLMPYLKLFDCYQIAYNYNGKLPLTIYGGKKITGEVEIVADKSSQFISGLLLNSPLNNADLIIKPKTNFVSKPYIDITIDVMRAFGVEVIEEKNQYYIKRNQQYRAREYRIEGDYSNAANWLVAGVLASGVKLKGLTKDSKQGDARIVDIMQSMGAKVFWQDDTLIAVPSETFGREIDAVDIPDLVPILSVLAAFSTGVTRIYNAKHLKDKESNRIESTADVLSGLGVDIKILDDGLLIKGGGQLKAATLDSYADHRIAMALAIAAIKNPCGVELNRADAVLKSYPDFWHDYRMLGGNFERSDR